MNWRAHLFLSEPTAAFRIGNLLPDLLGVPALAALPVEFQRGIECHRRVDAFTDSHPLVRCSVRRLHPPFRRYGGIIIDLFHDHFLARDWTRWSDVSLNDFAAEVYSSFETHGAFIPPAARARLKQMSAGDWLCSYRELDGIRAALDGIGSRLRRPFGLGASVSELERQYEALHHDFNDFFPELLGHIATFEPQSRTTPGRANVPATGIEADH